MAIFPNLIFEETVQINDRTRLDATKSFATQDEATISLVEIEPASGAGFINVTSDKFLDWEYSASGAKIVTVKVVTTGATGTIERTVTTVTVAEDALFSSDQDLVVHEADMMKWCKDGRNTYNDVHRRAQTLIIKWLDKEGYVDVFNKPYTKAAIIDVEEVKQWSIFIVLRLIFESISNTKDDIFRQKAKIYEAQEIEWRKRAVLRLDIDGDGKADLGEQLDPSYGFVTRR